MTKEPQSWVPLASVLVGAVVGGGFALLGGWRQRRGERRDARTLAKRDAYAQLLATSALVVHMADALRLTMAVRSGLVEGVDVTLRVRRPADPLELYAVLRRDFEPMYQAWARVWTVGSPEAVAHANDLVGRASRVLDVNTTRGKKHRGLLWWLAGEAWTDEQVENIRREVVAIAEVRKRFGELARRELGVEVADLFASAEPADESAAVA